jgi:hypothetical protein
MSEQSPERAALNEEPEVEGHRAALNEDPSVVEKQKRSDDDEGPEVEGHMKALDTMKAAEPSRPA